MRTTLFVLFLFTPAAVGQDSTVPSVPSVAELPLPTIPAPPLPVVPTGPLPLVQVPDLSEPPVVQPPESRVVAAPGARRLPWWANPESPWYFGSDFSAGTVKLSGTLIPPNVFRPVRPQLFPSPTAVLDETYGGRVAIGYRLPWVPGRVEVAWEGFGAEGRATLLGTDPTGARQPMFDMYTRNYPAPNWQPTVMSRSVDALPAMLRTRATANMVDLLYRDSIVAESPFQLIVGVRYVNLFSDDTAEGYGYRQSASNSFSGVGPLGGFKIDAAIAYVGVVGGTLFGTTTQRFRELDPLPTPRYSDAVATSTRAVPFISTELGFCPIVIPMAGIIRNVSAGVRYTQYFNAGRVGDSRLDVRSVLYFARLELPF